MKKQIGLIAIGFALATHAYALTNEEFVKEVQRQMRVLEKDKKALREAEEFCSLLSSARRKSEPRCVAAERVSFAQTTGPSSARIR
jgi:hypothetical protein